MSLLLVITGASRGLGAALAVQAVAAGHRVLGIARGTSAAGDSLSLDLSQPEAIEAPLTEAITQRIGNGVSGYALVNNAATIDPVGTTYDAQAASAHMALNLTAPIIASRAFIRALESVPAAKRIINIGSGASTRAIEGWSLYCASKAGLDHFGRCLALEQQRARYPVDVVGVSPGLIDTTMQARIRAADPNEFPELDHFRALHSGGKLVSADKVATKLLLGIERADDFAGAVLTVDAFAKNDRALQRLLPRWVGRHAWGPRTA
jgi:benzil reductase ((S)-benzoin forming)